MSALDHSGFVTPLPLTEGLLDWIRRQSRDTWHEIARKADFADPAATIDLLLALNWISLQPDCDRATALLILTRAAEAGLHAADCPAQMAPEAAHNFCRALYAALEAGGFLQESLALSRRDRALIDRQLGPNGPFPLSDDDRQSAGRTVHRPAFGFYRQRPVLSSLAA